MNILIVIDMQNDFIDGVLGSTQAAAIVESVAEKIRSHQGPVLYTRDTHDDLYLKTEEGRNLPVVHCIHESHGWELAPSIQKLTEEKWSKIFDKSSFGSPQLAQYASLICAQESVDALEIVGLCTDICVISNAMLLKSIMPDIPVFVHKNLCAGVTKESHENALQAMKMCHIQVIE